MIVPHDILVLSLSDIKYSPATIRQSRLCNSLLMKPREKDEMNVVLGVFCVIY